MPSKILYVGASWSAYETVYSDDDDYAGDDDGSWIFAASVKKGKGGGRWPRDLRWVMHRHEDINVFGLSTIDGSQDYGYTFALVRTTPFVFPPFVFPPSVLI